MTYARDNHLFGPGGKRILALDGGGVRGILSLAFLERMEAELAEKAGKPVRLCDHFDLIGGTSTGAIIAAGLALGYSASDIRQMYVDYAPKIFRRNWWRLQGLQSKFDAGALTAQIRDSVGARRLESEDLQTGFAIVAKRLDTGSAWILANNPRSPYWETLPGSTTIGNRHYPLASVARAKAYGIAWQTGPQSLTIISVGAGNFRSRLSALSARRQKAIGIAFHALTGMIGDA